MRWIGENFLVTGDGSIKNDFAVTFAFGAVAFASKDAPIFKGKDSLHSCSRDWILKILAGMQSSSNGFGAQVFHRLVDSVFNRRVAERLLKITRRFSAGNLT